MRVIDGMHRLRAAKLRNHKSIAVRFFDGDDIEAFVLAVKANRAHGLPLSLADRDSAAARILNSQPYASDRSVAGITGLSARTVAAIRRRINPHHDDLARIGRDGRVRPVNGAEGRRVASEVIVRQPDASLREIAKLASISPATARDVRDRMRRGENPIPSSQRGREQPGGLGPRRFNASRHGDVGSRVRDRAALFRNLTMDPSLRLPESGRFLLRWLHARAGGLDGWKEIVDSIPPHCSYLVAEVARSCADDWLAFARHLEHQIADSAS
jgi:hypothetical protein